MAKVKDLSGQRFGNLVVLQYFGRKTTPGSTQPRTVWRCRCDCGSEKIVEGGNLKRGSTISCGCVRSAWLKEETHGQTNSGVYSVWAMMHRRCSNQDDKDFERYGGRGIKVCPEWGDISRFVSDMGPRPVGLTLDREDNDGNYEPRNCRWASKSTQSNNTSSNRLLTKDGVTLTVSQWAVKIGVIRETLFARIRRGYTTDQILNPVVSRRFGR